MGIFDISNIFTVAQTKARQNIPGSLIASSAATATRDNSASFSATLSSVQSGDDPVQDFRDFMKESPAQRMMDEWLRAHGMTEAQFEAMSPSEKQKIVAEMKEDIEAQMKQKLDAAKLAATANDTIIS